MRKFLLFICIFAIFSTGVFAYQNTYNATSHEYRTLQKLVKLSGKNSVNMVSPITSEQMLIILNQIDTSKLDKTSLRYYNSLRNSLSQPDVDLQFADDSGAKGILSASYQYLKQAENEFDWLVAKKDRKPLLELGVDFYFKDFLFGTFNLDFTDVDNLFNKEEGKYEKYTDNVIKSFGWERTIDWSTPHTAFASAGYKGANVIVGRDRLSLGNGRTGNLTLADTLWYHDFVKASVLCEKLSYDFTAMYFSNSYKDHVNYPLLMEFNIKEPGVDDMNQYVVLHNISFTPNDLLNFSINEGALIYRSSLGFDFRNINPFFVLHNTFEYMTGHNAGNMNNFFGAEVNLNLGKGWAINLQANIDQIQMSGERSEDQTLPQSAFGVLLNATKAFTAFGGIGSAYIEGVYTSPNLYLKEEEVTCGEYWNLDLIVGNKLVQASSGIDEISYLGYKYGPDSLVFGLGFDWIHEMGLNIEFGTNCIIHGNQGAKFYSGQNDKTIGFAKGEKIKLVSGNLAEFRFVSDLKVTYNICDFMSVSGEIGSLNVLNYHNTDNSVLNDVQFAVSATVHPLNIFTKEKQL